MRKKLAVTISTILIIVMMVSSNVFAVRETIYLSANQVWNTRPAVSRTTNYSYVSARCYAVYPTDGGLDFFTRIQVKVTNTGGTTITNIYTLKETNSSDTKVYIYEGYLATSSVKFLFRGNSPDHAAYTEVEYVGN